MEHPSPVRSRSRPSLQQQYTARLQQDRESEGRCGICGVQTHRFCYHDAGNGSVLCKEPLDVEGEVRRGRCLLCHPMPVQDCDYTVHSGHSAASANGCASFPFANTSPNHIYEFPLMTNGMAQPQHHMFPPLPIQATNNGSTAMRLMPPPPPSLAIIQSIPNLDITSILTLMRMHPTSHALISTALQTLDLLSTDSQNSLALGRVGAIPTILDALTPYLTTTTTSCITTVQSASSLLYNLSKNQHNLPFMASTVPTLVCILNSHPPHANIQRSAILALGHIARYNIDYKILICEEGGMMAIMKAVEVFGDNNDTDVVGEGVLRAAYWSLRRLGMPRLRGLRSSIVESGVEDSSDEEEKREEDESG
ncbi:hypothetical protein ACHAXN_002572 [Cyclotella atomus]